jgi:hypothetical protein
VTVQLPPPDRLYSVWASVPGDFSAATPADLERKLLAKGADSLRQRCAGLRVGPLPGDHAEINVVVNDWNPGAAGMRLITLLTVKAGPGWDVHRATVMSGPLAETTVRSRPDSIEQGQTTTNAA